MYEEGVCTVIKVLVATGLTQGLRETDFNECIEGELVWVDPASAPFWGEPIDCTCDCHRAFVGMNSHRATTTARVTTVGLSRLDYILALRSSLEQQGLPTDEMGEILGWMSGLANRWPEGTVMERLLSDIVVRALPAPAP